jgi:hypothetical protein
MSQEEQPALRAPEIVTLDVGDVRPEPRTETRHLWAQELVRASLAIAFFLLLAMTVIWALVLAGGAGSANAKEALQILLPAETGLLGSCRLLFRQQAQLTRRSRTPPPKPTPHRRPVCAGRNIPPVWQSASCRFLDKRARVLGASDAHAVRIT